MWNDNKISKAVGISDGGKISEREIFARASLFVAPLSLQEFNKVQNASDFKWLKRETTEVRAQENESYPLEERLSSKRITCIHVRISTIIYIGKQ